MGEMHCTRLQLKCKFQPVVPGQADVKIKIHKKNIQCNGPYTDIYDKWQ